MEKYTYSFSFGDMQPSVHNSNGSVIHSYSMPGTYQASVVIQGSGVNVHFKTLVTVYGRYKGIANWYNIFIMGMYEEVNTNILLL